jgi:hypothetical protein
MVENGKIRRLDETAIDAELPKSELGHISVTSTTVNEANFNEFPSFETESTSSWD